MRNQLRILLTIVALSFRLVGQTSAPSKSPRAGQPNTPVSTQSGASSAVAHPSPSPTPTPPKTNPALAQAPITNGPKYSPTQLDFGAIDYGASAKRTFSLTSPLAGEITLEFPAGSFVAAEVRRTPPLNLGQAPANRALAPPMKPVPQSGIGAMEIYKWPFAAGEEMQLDILFAPSFSKDKSPGLRTANMKFSGPGSITPWAVTVPMRGIVNASKSNLSPEAPGPIRPAAPQSQAAQLAFAVKPADAQSVRALLPVLNRKTLPKIAGPQAAKAGNASLLAALNEQQNAARSMRAKRGPPMSTRSGPGNVPATQATVAPAKGLAQLSPTPQPTPFTVDNTSQQAMAIFICDQPKIRWVDKRYNTIFTPLIRQSNGNIEVPQHVIEGCQFGKQTGSAYLVGNFKKGQLPLTVNFWSDTEIDVALDSTLEGELDESNVTLVVKLADGTYIKANGYRFYATRGDPVALYVYPDYALSLEPTLIKPTSVITPLDGNQPGVFVGRLARAFEGKGLGFQGNVRRFDRFYLNKLTQGFGAVEADLTYWYISQPNGCIDALGLDHNGGPYQNIQLWSPNMDIVSTQWGSDYFEVDWTPQYCAWKAYGSNSLEYQVTIYVVGPKGVRPWADGKQ